MPEVSVVIPAYNAAGFLPDAIDSVLAQTMSDLEVIVVDDGSTDETESVVSRYGPPVRYLRQQNQGVSVARNRGIDESQGRYVAFLDADDTWMPHKLERQLEDLSRHPEHRICFSAFTRVDADLVPLGVSRGEGRNVTLHDLLTRGNVVGSICTIVCERSLLMEAGGFDSAFSQCADWDMWIRLACFTTFYYVDEPLVTYRQHDSNMSRNARLLEDDSLRVLAKGFGSPNLPSDLRSQRKLAFGRNYRVLAGTYFHAGSYRDCLRCLRKSLAHDVLQAKYVVAFPSRWIHRQRARRLRGVS